MTYAIAKAAKELLNKNVENASAELAKFDQLKNSIGLTPDHIKSSPEWKLAKRKFDEAFTISQEFNRKFNKTYKKEITAERRLKNTY